jgi:GTPase Era involved in 16S rRNA processing
MPTEIQQLIADVSEVTGAPAPAVLASDEPVLQDDAFIPSADQAPYFIGLIGGKDVGKSALVNALVGESISDSTSFGPGTETVIAYAHQSQLDAVKKLLGQAAPDRFRIIPHTIDRLQRQVLLDLPDIDSQYSDHVQLTRRMLRHMLFPLWVQSIEKYADRQPQQLLAQVTQGNDPANFIFVLNKVDQLNPGAIAELRDDYASRLARTLALASPPGVYAISALRPDTFDLPTLRKTLSQQRSHSAVKDSIRLASRQRDRSMLNWLDEQRLPDRLQRIDRLRREAEELIASRLTAPLLETVIPNLLDDPAHRAQVVEEVMDARAARWPIVNLVHTLLWPLTSIWRRNVGSAPTASSLVDASLIIQTRTPDDAIQTTFAMLQQTHPLISSLYRAQRLWESAAASACASDLRQTLIASLEQQRALAMSRIARRGWIAPPIRWLLTFGALLWFPLVQPVLELLLKNDLAQTLRGGLVLLVQLLGATYLLRSAAFLAIWFVFLWLVLRWDTQRKVKKLLTRWRGLEARDGITTPPARVIAWADELLDPIHLAAQREQSLVTRAESLKEKLHHPPSTQAVPVN